MVGQLLETKAVLSLKMSRRNKKINARWKSLKMQSTMYANDTKAKRMRNGGLKNWRRSLGHLIWSFYSLCHWQARKKLNTKMRILLCNQDRNFPTIKHLLLCLNCLHLFKELLSKVNRLSQRIQFWRWFNLLKLNWHKSKKTWLIWMAKSKTAQPILIINWTSQITTPN